MVYAMLIVFLLFLNIHTAHFQTTTTPISIYNCSFLSNTYITNAAVSNQFQFVNNTSIILTASYAFVSLPLSITTFDIGLIYPFSTSTYLVPFPVILNCASTVQSCQLETIAGTTLTSRDSEPINVQLTQFNYTSTSIQFNQMGLYLRQGQYQLRNCLLNNGQYITDNQTVFNIQIQYEKPVGTLCNPLTDTCGSSFLTNCSLSSLTCTCLSTSSLVSYSNSFYCADTINISNCSIFPTRCITWCNSTTNNLCICPSDTLKIQRNNFYVCELPVNSLNCSINDDIRRCPLGQTCINEQCMNDIITTTTPTTTNINNSNDSSDQRLRIALGVIAGLLGTSVIVLLGVCCWLRQKHKRHRRNVEKSFSPTSSSTTSSLYITPIEQKRNFPSTNTVYQLPIENNSNQRLSSIYRTDSFRQAVLSGYKRTNEITEHVSAKRDSFIRRSSYEKDNFGSPTYSTLEFIVPSPMIDDQNFDNNNNIYQVIIPSSSSTILTHAV